jgi:phosphopantothenoylcysteine decarboxylase/phosphopantothenate--cysteine ligase
MLEAVMAQVGQAEVFVAVAAVADWRVDQSSAVKLKKTDSAPPALRMVRNPDILAQVASLPSPPYCVGFAAESEQVGDNARAKLAAKKVPLIVANLAQDVLGSDQAELMLVDERSTVTWPRAGKIDQARRLVAEIAARLPPRIQT